MTTRVLWRCALLTIAVAPAIGANGAERRIDGSFNHPTDRNRGAAGTAMIRVLEGFEYANAAGGIIGDAQRPNPRRISNGLSRQTTNKLSARRLSDYIWGWGQFLDHDLSLTSNTAGATVNGSAPIAITEANDPLGPNPIAFVRSNFVTTTNREQVNDVTSWIDGSQVYGSSTARATALRAGGGTGAKLLTGVNNLLPLNTGGLANQNNGTSPANQLFLAGDIRANENLLLTSLQTVFMREHNRVVDKIAAQMPSLNAESQYRLARAIVGAEIQAITYKEFLPALLGSGAPTPQAYVYNSNLNGSVTNAFAHSAYRFGHSALSSTLRLSNANGTTVSNLPFADAFFNPNQITNNPAIVDQALMGASLQTSQEIDLLIVDSVRNVSFGPGAGGTDLAAVDIQRGRDHGLPDYNELRTAYGLPALTAFTQITSDATVSQKLASGYRDINNIDAFVGGLAETQLAGSSLGALNTAIIVNQFTRSRDGDLFFYRGNTAGLYLNGVLRPEIAAIVNLDVITLSNVITSNTGLTALSSNLFFAPATGALTAAGNVPEPSSAALAAVLLGLVASRRLRPRC